MVRRPALFFGLFACMANLASAGIFPNSPTEQGGHDKLAGKYDFVTDPALCRMDDIDRQERGMSFDGLFFYEIEYGCTLKTPLMFDWNVDQTQVEVGYCQEPGALFPGVFVFRTFAQDPGILNVWMDTSGEPTVFHLCPR